MTPTCNEQAKNLGREWNKKQSYVTSHAEIKGTEKIS